MSRGIVPERVVFCLDTGIEMFQPLGKAGESRVDAVKDGIRRIVSVKQALDPRHEFGLCLLAEDGAEWCCGFTSNTADLFRCLDQAVLKERQDTPGSVCAFDLSLLLEILQERMSLPSWEVSKAGTVDDTSLSSDLLRTPPLLLKIDFLCRAVLFFGRSEVVPVYSRPRHGLLDHPYFVWDVIYLHDKPTEHNCCQDILDALLKAEGGDECIGQCPSFLFMLNAAARSAPTRLTKMGALLCLHPSHRGDQCDADECMAIQSSLGLAARARNYFALNKPQHDTAQHASHVCAKYGNMLLPELFKKYGPEPTQRQADSHRQQQQ